MELLDISDIAELLQVTKSRVYQLMAKGELPSVRVGGRIRVPRTTWETFWENKGREALLASSPANNDSNFLSPNTESLTTE